MPTRKPPAPVDVVTVPPAALKAALRLADGDATRLRPQHDGSVLVLNAAKRPTAWDR